MRYPSQVRLGAGNECGACSLLALRVATHNDACPSIRSNNPIDMASCSGRIVCPCRVFTSPRLSVYKGRHLLKQSSSGKIVLGADSADNAWPTQPTPPRSDERSQHIEPVSPKVSTSGRSVDSGADNSNGPITHATAPQIDPYLTPTQSWGGDEVSGLKLTKQDTDKPKLKSSGSGLAMRVVFGLLMGIAGASAVLVKPLFLLAATFIAYHATIGEPSMGLTVECMGSISSV